MSRNYFEFSLTLDTLKKVNLKLLECILKQQDLSFQIDSNPFQGKYLLSIFKNNDHLQITKCEKSKFLQLFKKIHSNYILISCDDDYSEFITLLFKNTDLRFILIENILYCKTSKYRRFITDFLIHFNKKVTKSCENLEYYLNLKRLSLPQVNLNSDVGSLMHNIYHGMNKSNYYEITDDIDLMNIKNISNSKLLKFYYYQETVKAKYILIKSLMKINKNYNLPTNTIKKILKNLDLDNHVETFNFYYYSLISKYQKIENFQYISFKKLDDSISYSMDLEKQGIRGILVEKDDLFHICYENNIRINHTNNLRENKNILIEILRNLSPEKYNFNKYTLSQLVNVQFHENKIYFEDSENLPISLKFNQGTHIYNLTGSFINFIDKDYLFFNREDIDMSSTMQIKLVKKIENYYGIIIILQNIKISGERDLFIPGEKNRIEEKLKEIVKKGYLITDFGILRYITNYELFPSDISLPEWLVSNNQEDYRILMDSLLNL